MSWFIDVLHRKSHFMKLKKFQEIAKDAEKCHVDKEAIYDFLIKCNIREEDITKIWNLCDKNITNFMFCLLKEESGSITIEQIHENIDKNNEDFFRQN
jgi:hypothetical protein